MAPKVTLYDLDGKRRPWNLNVFKTRQLLHAKNVDFEVEYAPYCQLKGKLTDAGFRGDTSKTWPWPSHTVPTVRFDHDGESEIVADSEKIAPRIEEYFPGRGLVVDQQAEVYKRVDHLITTFQSSIAPMIPWHVYNSLILDKDHEYFRESRIARMNIDLSKPLENEEELWTKGSPHIAELGELLLRQPGPYLEGQTPTYGDVRILAMLSIFHVIGPRAFEQFLSYDEHGGIAKLWRATKAWRPELD